MTRHPLCSTPTGLPCTWNIPPTPHKCATILENWCTSFRKLIVCGLGLVVPADTIHFTTKRVTIYNNKMKIDNERQNQ